MSDSMKSIENLLETQPPSRGLYEGLIRYDDVALIVNDNSGMSKEIGTYFAMRRGLNETNIINITAPAQETINQDQFDDMAAQIKENLSDRGLTNKIQYLVTTKGVPLRVSGSNWRAASVDSELMLLDSQYEGQIHSSGFFENPYFPEDGEFPPDEKKPFSREEYGIRLVTRLTGYTKEEAMRLVDLAENTLGSRGKALLDMDPRKGISSGGYGVGNLWMYNANTWLQENGWESHLDNNNTFVTEWNETMAYFSWGSNDGDWGRSQMSNTGFESGSGPSASSWTFENTGGVVERTTDSADSGSWSLNLTRNRTGVLRAYQDIDLNYPDHRYIADGKMKLEGVTSPGARIVLEGYDSNDILLWTHELANRTGTRNWGSYQDPVENDTRVTTIRYIVELLGEGTAYFDSTNLRVIRPHNTYVKGSIAETCVSTGGRSQTYGTWYGQSLIADLIRDGVTGVKGYAYEPFLSAISHADILFPAYYTGHNLAESFWMGSQLASWMGYVVGDPKCTPFLNERPDMGFKEGVEPVQTLVDEEGTPYISINLHNKGNNDVEKGKVELFLDGGSIWNEKVTIPAGEDLIINITSEEEPIAGTHEFTLILNGDASIWEYDPSNNEFKEILTVNSVPELSMEIERSSLSRTEVLNITVSVTDPDSDISLNNLYLSIEDPLGRESEPESVSEEIGEGSTTYAMRFIPPWNATQGFYSVSGTYTDPNGSFSREILFSAFRVLNHEPSLTGEISLQEVPRGDSFRVNLTWEDPDTPDGALEISMHASNSLGKRIEPDDFVRTSDNTGFYNITIPARENSGSWILSAEVKDRDGSAAEWSETMRTYNLPPEMILVEGSGQNITRLEDASFTLGYTDPEGLASDGISAMVVGPMEGGGGTTVLERELELDDGDEASLTVDGSGLAIGRYVLRVDYQDDEREGGTLTVDPLFNVLPIAPNISGPMVSYQGSQGEPGGSFLKGESISFSVEAEDPDGGVVPLSVEGVLISPEGEEREVFLESRGGNIFRARITTDGTWETGPYSLMIYAIDSDGQNDTYFEEILFILEAEYPVFDQGEIRIFSNRTFTAEVTIQSFQSSSVPVKIALYMLDENGSELGRFDLLEEGGFGSWQGEGLMENDPVSASLLVEDDIGRTFWINGTFEILIDEDDIPIDDDVREDNGTDNTLLMIIIAGSVILLVILLAVLFIVLTRKGSTKGMVPAPPLATPLPGQEDGGLPSPNSTPGLPSGGTQQNQMGPGESPALPPGSTLEEGGSYHRPQPATVNPPSEPQNLEQADEIPKAPMPPVNPVEEVPMAAMPSDRTEDQNEDDSANSVDDTHSTHP